MSAMDPITIPPSLWKRPETLTALQARDIGHLFRFVRQYAGVGQTHIAIACGMTQGKVSQYMTGGRQVLALDVFERIADGFAMPDQARMVMGLAPKTIVGVLRSGNVFPESVDSSPAVSPETKGTEDGEDTEDGEGADPLRRRAFHRLAAAGVFSAVPADLPGSGAPLDGVEAFAAALAGSPDAPGGLPDSTRSDVSALDVSVASAKRDYQACHYSTVIEELPGLLSKLRVAGEVLEGDARLQVPVTERKATLFIDTSRALVQWGKHDKAYEILRAAERLAPEEVSARPAVHRLLRDLLTVAPAGTVRQVRKFARQIGVRL